MTAADPIHATAIAIAIDSDGPLAGALILGDPGAGKSSLALAAIDACPFQRTVLIADDAVLVEATGAGLLARAPPRIAGLIEVRGFGPLPVRHAATATLHFAVDLGAQSGRIAEQRQMRPVSDAATLPLYPFWWSGAESTAAARLRIVARSIICGKVG